MTSRLYTYADVSGPTATLHGTSKPFVTLDLDAGPDNWLSVTTLSSARAWQAAANEAARLLEEAAAKAGLCPECWEKHPGHTASCTEKPGAPSPATIAARSRSQL